MQHVPFDYFEHLVTLPVTAGDVETRFVFDSGIGLTLLGVSLARRLGCEAAGSAFSGRRRSGQQVFSTLSA